MIVLKNVTKSFKQTRVLNGISLDIEPGEFVCITGPSGVGKSTLLSLLIGADSPTAGSVSVDGVDLRTVPSGALQLFRRKVGMVFQDYKLLRNRTVEENIAFPLEVCGIPDSAIQKRINELLKRVDLEHRRRALPDELSGGEKARTAIARALAHKPLIVLADEPTGNLDREAAAQVMTLFKEIHADGTTVIVATHDPALLERAGARIIRMVQGMVAMEGKKHATKAHASTEHHEPVIERREPEGDGHGRVTHEAKKKSSPAKDGGGHRKIRITAIHSDVE